MPTAEEISIYDEQGRFDPQKALARYRSQPMAGYLDPDTKAVQPGQWIQPAHDAPPVYVTHPEHIKRLTQDGGYPIADPRSGGAALPLAPKTSNEAALLAKMEELQAEIERLRATQAHLDQTWDRQGSATAEPAPTPVAKRGK